MSAFVLDSAHISAIATYYDLMVKGSFQQWTAGQIGRELLSENVKSVGYRYQDTETEQNVATELANYCYQADLRLMQQPDLSATILKLCDCYVYQSCEHPEWTDCNANKIIQMVRSEAIGRLPGYDAAPWHYNGMNLAA